VRKKHEATGRKKTNAPVASDHYSQRSL
jgi:hypothetical protein